MEKAMKQSPLQYSIPMSIPFYPRQWVRPSTISTNVANQWKAVNGRALILCCFDSSSSASSSWSSNNAASATMITAPPVVKRRKRYRKQYPGESKGITEEMRFVAMRLRNINGKKYKHESGSDKDDGEVEEDNNATHDSTSNEFVKGGKDGDGDGDEDGGDVNGESETWQPSIPGFLKYLVDSEVVFNTIERIVDDSNDVAYAYFRKTGLERSDRISRDIEWFREKGMEIPEPSSQGVTYAKYLEELSEKSAPQFLCHFYNIYFSHIAGGQVITRQVSDKLLDGRELEFNKWDGDLQELLKGFREKLNMLGEHWSRDEKNKCLREATKSFRFLGQIVRLIIL